MQAEAPEEEKVPRGQYTQVADELALIVDENVPSGHKEQPLADASSAYEPGRHARPPPLLRVHCEAPATEVNPIAQARQSAVLLPPCALRYEFAGHGLGNAVPSGQ